MCQYARECKNFKKDPTNSSSCMILCARNPLLTYEIADLYLPMRGKGHEPEIEFDQPQIIRPAPLKQVLEEEAKTKAEARQREQDVAINEALEHSFDSEELDPANQPDVDVVKVSDKYEREQDEIAEAVARSTGQDYDAQYPKRERRKRGA